MDLVVDANILFSVLIKNSLNYHLLFKDKLHLYAPEYIFVEIEKHKEEILKKTERTTDEFYYLIEALKRRIMLVPLEELTDYIEEAERITPDPGDMVYFALALKLSIAIWSNDKDLKEKQKAVKVYSTEEVKDL